MEKKWPCRLRVNGHHVPINWFNRRWIKGLCVIGRSQCAIIVIRGAVCMSNWHPTGPLGDIGGDYLVCHQMIKHVNWSHGAENGQSLWLKRTAWTHIPVAVAFDRFMYYTLIYILQIGILCLSDFTASFIIEIESMTLYAFVGVDKIKPRYLICCNPITPIFYKVKVGFLLLPPGLSNFISGLTEDLVDGPLILDTEWTGCLDYPISSEQVNINYYFTEMQDLIMS